MISESKTNGARRRPAHVLLTERDVELMVGLHDHVVSSVAQIRDRYFAGRTVATVMNRLRRIEDQGLIIRIRVPRLNIIGSEKMTGVVFQLSTKGRSTLSKFKPAMPIFEKCPAINPHQLDHDLLVGDIARFFRRRFPDCQWTNGRYLMDTDGLNKIPDAVLKTQNGGKVIAIELELNGKSSRRYREIVATLKASRRLEKVIYVTSSTSIGRKIMSAIEGFHVPEGHVLSSDFFEFVRLSECLKVKEL